MRDQAEKFQQHRQEKQTTGKKSVIKSSQHFQNDANKNTVKEVRKALAATKIQACYRGYLARKKLRRAIERT